MKNEGVELLVSAHLLTGTFKWKTSLNFSKNKNSVTNIQGQVIEINNRNFINRAIEGQAIGVFFAPEFAGVDPNNGDALYYLNTKMDDGTLDKRTTNNLSEANGVVIGDPNPDFIYGFSNTFSYRGLELQILFQGVADNDIYLSSNRFQLNGFGWFDNQDIRILNRWQQAGDQTDIPQVRFLQGTSHSSRFIEDGSYLRLKNLTFSYQLPTHWVEKIGLRQLKLYGTGQNLWLLTKYKGRDPEVNTDFSDFFENGRLVSGMDFFTPPQAKTLIFGIKAGF